jgi:hypothetical protein
MGRIDSSDVFRDEKAQYPSCYLLRVKPDGGWEILSAAYNKPTVSLASGTVTIDRNQWHHLELSFHGKQISASIDSNKLATTEDSTHAHGMFGLGTGWDHVQFDSVSVEP